MFTGDLPRRVAELERQLRNLTSGRRLEDAAIGARGVRLFGGGSLTLEDGGNIDVTDEGDITITGGKLTARDINGDIVFAVDTADPASVQMNMGPDGTMAVAGGASIVLTDGGGIRINGGSLRMTNADNTKGLLYFGDTDSGTRTWLFSFPNGEVAFGLLASSSPGYWGGLDHAANLLISNDAASGVGFAKPYLNIPMVPSSGTSVVVGGPFWPAFTNTSYQEVMHCITTLWHPRIAIGVGTNTTSGTVDWQLRIDGTTAGSASGTTSGTFAVPGWGSTIKPDGVAHSVQLWCRNTSGTQSRVIVDRCYGLGS